MQKDETSLFDGIDISLAALAQYAGAESARGADRRPRRHRRSGASARKQAFDAGNDAGTAAPIEAGLAAVRALRAQLALDGPSATPRATKSISACKIKERDYEDAVLAAHGVTFDAVADDGLVIAGQPVKLSLVAVNRGASESASPASTIAGFDCAGRLRARRRQEGCRLHLHRRRARPEGRAA